MLTRGQREYAAHGDRTREWFERNPHKRLFHQTKARAKQDGVIFTLTEEWIKDRIAGGKCEVTGLPFSDKLGDNDMPAAWIPSIDREDVDGPYSEDNCRMVVWIYNRARGRFMDDELLTMAKALTERNP